MSVQPHSDTSTVQFVLNTETLNLESTVQAIKVIKDFISQNLYDFELQIRGKLIKGSESHQELDNFINWLEANSSHYDDDPDVIELPESGEYNSESPDLESHELEFEESIAINDYGEISFTISSSWFASEIEFPNFGIEALAINVCDITEEYLEYYFD